MTKEIADIVAAFKEAQKHGRRAALATVVHVEGLFIAFATGQVVGFNSNGKYYQPKGHSKRKDF